MKKINFKPGFLIICEFSATGGVSYQREVVRQEENETEQKIVRTVDNLDIHKESKAIVGAAYYAIEKYCVNTPVGYLADQKAAKDVEEALGEVRECAKTLNEIAELLKSDRRVKVVTMPMKADFTPKMEARLTLFIRERMREIISALGSGDRHAYETAMERARNLDHLVEGAYSDSIRLFFLVSKDRRDEMTETLRSGDVLNLDLTALENIVKLFDTGEPLEDKIAC